MCKNNDMRNAVMYMVSFRANSTASSAGLSTRLHRLLSGVPDFEGPSKKFPDLI